MQRKLFLLALLLPACRGMPSQAEIDAYSRTQPPAGHFMSVQDLSKMTTQQQLEWAADQEKLRHHAP